MPDKDALIQPCGSPELRESWADTNTTYANHIQVLTLRNAELEEENQRLRQRLERMGDNLTMLRDR